MNRMELGEAVYVRPMRAVNEVVSRLIPKVFDGLELRTTSRYPITMNATAAELDQDHEITGKPWTLLTSTLSEEGIGLVSSRPVSSELMVIELPILQQPQFLVRVAWQKQVDKYHCLGVEILGRL